MRPENIVGSLRIAVACVIHPEIVVGQAEDLGGKRRQAIVGPTRSDADTGFNLECETIVRHRTHDSTASLMEIQSARSVVEEKNARRGNVASWHFDSAATLDCPM